jgi:hypothetical protein
MRRMQPWGVTSQQWASRRGWVSVCVCLCVSLCSLPDYL